MPLEYSSASASAVQEIIEAKLRQYKNLVVPGMNVYHPKVEHMPPGKPPQSRNTARDLESKTTKGKKTL